MQAPATPGIYRTQWTLKHGEQPFGPPLSVDVTVRPRLEEDWGKTIEEWLRTTMGRLLEAFEDWWRGVQRELEKWLEEELEKQLTELCGGPAVLMLVGALVLIRGKNRTRGPS